MKKILFLAVAMSLLFSCGSDNSSGTSTDWTSAYGTYSYNGTSYSYKYCGTFAVSSNYGYILVNPYNSHIMILNAYSTSVASLLSQFATYYQGQTACAYGTTAYTTYSSSSNIYVFNTYYISTN